MGADLDGSTVLLTGASSGIESDAFEHYLPDMRDLAAFKTQDPDVFLAGAVAFADERAERA
jgi:hypothetical protein